MCDAHRASSPGDEAVDIRKFLRLIEEGRWNE